MPSKWPQITHNGVCMKISYVTEHMYIYSAHFRLRKFVFYYHNKIASKKTLSWIIYKIELSRAHSKSLKIGSYILLLIHELNGRLDIVFVINSKGLFTNYICTRKLILYS